MLTVLHIMVELERMLNYRGVGLERFHCIYNIIYYIYVPLTIETGAVREDYNIS